MIIDQPIKLIKEQGTSPCERKKKQKNKTPQKSQNKNKNKKTSNGYYVTKAKLSSLWNITTRATHVLVEGKQFLPPASSKTSIMLHRVKSGNHLVGNTEKQKFT